MKDYPFNCSMEEKGGKYIVTVSKDNGMRATFSTDSIDEALDLINAYRSINETSGATRDDKGRLSSTQQARLHKAYSEIFGGKRTSRKLERISHKEDDAAE
tara:strand:- start:87 stop:389 length:303 start_codon:yes stop_codon:yes gene_type:complete